MKIPRECIAHYRNEVWTKVAHTMPTASMADLERQAQWFALKRLGVDVHPTGPGPLLFSPIGGGVLDVSGHEVRSYTTGIDLISKQP